MTRYVVCKACEGTGYDWAYGNNPSEKPFKVPCNVCDAQGAVPTADIIPLNKMPRAATPPAALEAAARPVVLRNDGRAVPHQSLPPRAGSVRGTLAAQAGLALSYDASADRWIVPPSRMMRDAGVAAEPRHILERHSTEFSQTPDCLDPAASPTTAAGRFDAAVEVLTVISGMMVFGALAGFFWIL